MGFLDDISVAFSKGASRVEDGAKTLKLKTDLADARNRRDRMMGELGRQVYPLIADKPEFVEGREELFSDIAAVDGEITGIENQIAEVERAAAERKAQEEAAAQQRAAAEAAAQQRAAAQAAAAQSAAQAVSQATGAPMPAGYATVSQPAAAACLQCGADVAVGAAFCSNCGAKLEAPAAAPVAASDSVAAAAPQQPAVPAQPAAAPQQPGI